MHTIIPTLNEAAALPALLAALQAQGLPPGRIVLVDGGSSDQTCALAAAAGVTVLHCPAGRARQLQHGIGACPVGGVWLLHADTRLHAGAVAAAQAVADSPAPVWGRFGIALDDRHWLLQLVAWLINRRSCLTGIATGDQGLVLSAAALAAVGGVPQQPLMEDVELSARLKRAVGRPRCLPVLLVTSARRWRQHGMLRTILTMWWLRLRYWGGADPAALYRTYYGSPPTVDGPDGVPR